MPITVFKNATDGLQPLQRRRDEFAVYTNFKDEKRWVPYGVGSWFYPLFFDVSSGGFANILKIRPGAKLPVHYHVSTVHAYTIQGTWFYTEHKHKWVAQAGTYVYETPGELHTLIVPADAKEDMLAFFVLSGGLIYINEDGTPAGYDDGFTLLELARKHWASVGLDVAEIDQLVR
ncbi:cupin [Planctomycetota bacterium]|nr:cupin [Planctomycetota bacterium]